MGKNKKGKEHPINSNFHFSEFPLYLIVIKNQRLVSSGYKL